MLKGLAVVVFFSVLAGGLADKPSKGGVENEGVRIISPQQEGRRNDQGGYKSPTVVVQVGSQPSDSVEANEKKDNDRDLATYTLFLAIFTAVLVVVSGGQGYFLYKQAKLLKTHASHLDELANASTVSSGVMTGIGEAITRQAELMSKTMILQYRPKIIVRNAKVLNSSFEFGKPWEFEVTFQVVNAGGTAARVSAQSYIQMASTIGHDVGRIEIKWGEVRYLGAITLQPGQSVTIKDSVLAGVTFNIDWENFNQGIKVSPIHAVHFTGAIFYADDLNIPRSTGMHRGLEPKSREFTANKETEQEYSD